MLVGQYVTYSCMLWYVGTLVYYGSIYVKVCRYATVTLLNVCHSMPVHRYVMDLYNVTVCQFAGMTLCHYMLVRRCALDPCMSHNIGRPVCNI